MAKKTTPGRGAGRGVLDEKGLAAEWLPTDSLQPDPKNTREHGDEDVSAIAASIDAFGWGEVIIARKADRMIIAGEGRWRAALLREWPEVPVRLLDLTVKEARELSIASNRIAELSKWNGPRLGKMLARVSESRRKLVGFDEATLRRVIGAPKGKRKRTSEDDAADLTPPENPTTKLGDVIKLGPHRVLCADSMVVANLRLALSGAVADGVVTDPPFAIYGSSTGIGRDIADDKMVRPFFEQLFRNASEVVKDFAHLYIHTDWRSWAAQWEAGKAAGLSPKNGLVWDKGDGGLGSMWGNCYELIAFWSKLPPATAMRSTERKGQRQVYKPNILRFPRVTGEEREHNAAKPVGLEAELIEAATDVGELILEPFGGSGTTLIACEKTSRRCALLEIEPKWCDVIVARWERLTGQQAERP